MQRAYAELIVKTGLNIQQGQTLVITSQLECAPFVRTVAEAAYQAGARDVVVNWRDELLAKIRFMNAPDEVFHEFPDWQKDFYMSYALKGAAFLRISVEDPELMKDVDPSRIAAAQKAGSIAMMEYMDRTINNKNPWCVVSAPTKAWAKKVFPQLDDEAAVEKLWSQILQSVRADQDSPVAAWEKHKETLKSRTDWLNQYRFKELQFQNSLGTDLSVELPEKHLWLGGSSLTQDGIEFIPNLPTEEIFTLPKKTGINGRVVSSMPLNSNGNLIEDFSLTIESGKIVDYAAKKGYETLKNLLETDEGASYLGEVALVPYDSPISNTNILFYNTLFDENASCHLAIGRAYPVCLTGGDSMDKDELLSQGANQSLIHEDFMIGTKDLTITGITQSGEKIPVFVEGNFAF